MFFFILPENGPVSDYLQSKNIKFAVIRWPKLFGGITRSKNSSLFGILALFPFMVFQILIYVNDLKRQIPQGWVLFCCGIKSHIIGIAQKTVFNQDTIINIRDFISPYILMSFIRAVAKDCGIPIVVNSFVVGKAYYSPLVCYPAVYKKKPDDTGLLAEKKRLQILHAAYFAPYKGQLEYLNYCKKISKKNSGFRFVIAGDVIYSSREHFLYKQKLLETSKKLELENVLEWKGDVKNIDVLFRESFLLLHCTLTPEPFGRVIVEALQNGCDVICHKDSGACEIISPVLPIEESPLYPIINDPSLCYINARTARLG